MECSRCHFLRPELNRLERVYAAARGILTANTETPRATGYNRFALAVSAQSDLPARTWASAES
jgi:hypothetical protein